MSKIVQISCLGGMGRFGNQILQYAVARKYAQDAGAILETPGWIGQKLFGLTDPPITRRMPRTPPDVLQWGKGNIDLYGYFQFQDAVGHLRRNELKQWFKIKQCWLDLCPHRTNYVAAHVRRGDYVTNGANVYATISEQSYLNACVKFGLDTSKLIFVREDAPQRVKELENEGLDFLPDFVTLLEADVLLRANSTFSWWAGCLGSGTVYAPLVNDLVGRQDVDFIEGNWPKMCSPRNSGGNLTDLYVPD
jgi:hypothetical protein